MGDYNDFHWRNHIRELNEANRANRERGYRGTPVANAVILAIILPIIAYCAFRMIF
jgi:hypothetical protein